MTPKRKRENKRRIRRAFAVQCVVIAVHGALFQWAHQYVWAAPLSAVLLVVATMRLTIAVAVDKFDLRKGE